MTHTSSSPNFEARLTQSDHCAAALFEGSPPPLTQIIEQGVSSNSIEYSVGERACAAFLTAETAGLHRGQGSYEFAIGAQTTDVALTHYLYFPGEPAPYWLPAEERAVDATDLTSGVLMHKVAQNQEASMYRVPEEAVSLSEVIMDALPGHDEIIKKVFGSTLDGLRTLAADLGCLPPHISLVDVCVSRQDGMSTLIPPLKLRTYGARASRSQLRALAYELASDIQKRAAIAGKDVDLAEELNRFTATF